MRVGIICPYSLTLPGGVQDQVLALGRALRRRGVDARVLGPCDGAPPDPAVTPLGNSLPTADNGSIVPVAPDLPAQLRTIRSLRDEAFDVLHLHEPMAPGPTNTALVMKAAPIVATFHRAGASAWYRALTPLTHRLARRIDYGCAVSEEARALAVDALGGEYEVLYNGVEVARTLDIEPHGTDGPTIFFLGRHEQRKGLAVLLAAMEMLPADTRLWVGGEGPETEELRERSAGDRRIEWLGRLSDRDKRARLRGATVFCAPSLHGESFGVVLLEAMAAQTPVVASDISGYAKVARPGREALLVPPGDPAELARALREVLDDDELADRLVAAGNERADSLSMARLAARYEEIYRSIV